MITTDFSGIFQDKTLKTLTEFFDGIIAKNNVISVNTIVKVSNMDLTFSEIAGFLVSLNLFSTFLQKFVTLEGYCSLTSRKVHLNCFN